jgi:hypothetical protein
MSDLPVLSVREKAGDGGVTRLTYWLGSKHIGSARVMKTTLGEINVNKFQRRKGYGTQILKDLENRGVTTTLTVTDERAAFFKEAGWITRDGWWWTKPTEERLSHRGKLFASPWWQVQTLFLRDIIT